MASSYHLLGSERNAFNFERQCFYQRWWWRAPEFQLFTEGCLHPDLSRAIAAADGGSELRNPWNQTCDRLIVAQTAVMTIQRGLLVFLAMS